jgi:hypothetical protein
MNGVRNNVNSTKILLLGGVIAGPLYLIVSLIEAFTREGFEITHHSLSLLSNGSFGWIHITLFVVSGLLVVGSAMGMRRTLLSGIGRVWAPLLLGLYGLGLIGSGIFVADPSFGFPPGTPNSAPTAITTSGLLHFAVGGVGFLGLIAVCFVMARRFGSLGQRSWKTFSWITGAVFLLGFIGIASGSGSGWTTLGFWIAVVLSWAWLSAVSAKLRKEL